MPYTGLRCCSSIPGGITGDIQAGRVDWLNAPRIPAWLSSARTSARSPWQAGSPRAACPGPFARLSPCLFPTEECRTGPALQECCHLSRVGRVTLVMQLVAFFARRVFCWLLGACCHPDPQVLLPSLCWLLGSLPPGVLEGLCLSFV